MKLAVTDNTMIMVTEENHYNFGKHKQNGLSHIFRSIFNYAARRNCCNLNIFVENSESISILRIEKYKSLQKNKINTAYHNNYIKLNIKNTMLIAYNKKQSSCKLVSLLIKRMIVETFIINIQNYNFKLKKLRPLL